LGPKVDDSFLLNNLVDCFLRRFTCANQKFATPADNVHLEKHLQLIERQKEKYFVTGFVEKPYSIILMFYKAAKLGA